MFAPCPRDNLRCQCQINFVSKLALSLSAIVFFFNTLHPRASLSAIPPPGEHAGQVDGLTATQACGQAGENMTIGSNVPLTSLSAHDIMLVRHPEWQAGAVAQVDQSAILCV
jgi:hypothetical protein